MSKVIRKAENKSKALQLKLEEETTNLYHISLAGITVNMAACSTGACGDSPFIDTETYINQSFPDLRLALEVYNNYKSLYLD